MDAGQPFPVLVDYAHTPDSLENVLTTVRGFTKGNIICVVGCGGDRDRSKRPQMARIAAENSNLVLITSDNPRTEDPRRIIEDMLAGVKISRRPDRSDSGSGGSDSGMPSGTPKRMMWYLSPGKDTKPTRKWNPPRF